MHFLLIFLRLTPFTLTHYLISAEAQYCVTIARLTDWLKTNDQNRYSKPSDQFFSTYSSSFESPGVLPHYTEYVMIWQRWQFCNSGIMCHDQSWVTLNLFTGCTRQTNPHLKALRWWQLIILFVFAVLWLSASACFIENAIRVILKIWISWWAPVPCTEAVSAPQRSRFEPEHAASCCISLISPPVMCFKLSYRIEP